MHMKTTKPADTADPGTVKLADFRVEWEHDMNRLVGQRYRVVGLVNLWGAK